MKGKTHLASGIAAATVICTQEPTFGAVSAAALVLGTLLPDIDNPDSMLGHYIPVLPRLVKHRTVFHSVWFFLLASLIHPYLGTGVGIHIILDLFNPKGVFFLWPFRIRLFHRDFSYIRVPFISSFIPSGGFADNIFCVFFVLVACFNLVRIFLG